MDAFSIAVTPQDDKLILRPSGKVDSSNAPAFGAELARLGGEHPEGRIELDFMDMSYISSAGLRELLKLQKGEEGKIRVTNTSPKCTRSSTSRASRRSSR